ncbi:MULTISPECIES: nuclear transport factor 2 family protein [Sphingobium]|jgi:ABC-type uncharacterized transport system substrate-binding protein|uniref:SnoaL-like domain-containing protein n=1 Tax=Sphingobium baderi TaxID=1332080 RepID=A0A0S3F2R5_9SPHN|nr:MULTISPECIES: nuclear transport factor 2 family protein [Sphingobium]ALR22017.1 hypothetical protein ATN00_18640 [Sphingobium baderi]
MSDVSKQDIENFITNQYRLWSENRIDEMMDLFRAIAPNGFTIQYVGAPEVEGEKAMADMIAEYAGKIRTDLVRLLINGNEAATVVDNIRNDTEQVIPSIETYRFENGKMYVRYFH